MLLVKNTHAHAHTRTCKHTRTRDPKSYLIVIVDEFIITEDDLSDVYTVEDAVHKIGFGVFQIFYLCSVDYLR